MRLALLLFSAALIAGVTLSPSVALAGEDSLDEALDQDLTPLSPSDGAVFVPSLTSPDAEPTVTVLHGGERIAAGSTGQRIVLPPGNYRVVLSSLDGAEPASADVVVRRGQTTTLKPFFGAIRVTLVDPNGSAFAGDYVVATARERTVVARGSVDPTAKQQARTFLLPPGEYVVVYGSSASSLDDSYAVSLSAGSVVRYRLVVDGDHVVRSEFGDAPATSSSSIWSVRWLVGASGSATRTVNTLSTVQGDSILVDLYSRFEGGIDTKQHNAKLRVDLDQRLISLDESTGWKMPLRPITNEVTGELLYNFRLGGIVGPYVRGLGRTAIFATNVRAPRDIDVTTVDAEQKVIGKDHVAASNNVRLFAPLAPLIFIEDAGLALTVLDNQYVSFGVRGGPGLRQAYFNGGRFIKETNDKALLLQQLGDNSAFGGVGTAYAEVRLFSTVQLASRFDAFVASDQLDKTIVPVFRWDNTAALRLGRYVSLAYQFSLRRDDVALPELQTMQGLQLRASYGIF